MPDTTWPASGHPPGSSRAFLLRPGFDAIYLSYDSSTAIPENEDCAPSFRSPPDATVQQELPDVLLQWEDFANAHALPILQRYRDKLLTFNDDIQGTAAVTLGALHGAAKVAGRPLSQQQIVWFGAGSA